MECKVQQAKRDRHLEYVVYFIFNIQLISHLQHTLVNDYDIKSTLFRTPIICADTRRAIVLVSKARRRLMSGFDLVSERHGHRGWSQRIIEIYDR